jgi:hypothetical protein
MAELHLHSPVLFRGVVLNSLSTGQHYLFYLNMNIAAGRTSQAGVLLAPLNMEFLNLI